MTNNPTPDLEAMWLANDPIYQVISDVWGGAIVLAISEDFQKLPPIEKDEAYLRYRRKVFEKATQSLTSFIHQRERQAVDKAHKLISAQLIRREQEGLLWVHRNTELIDLANGKPAFIIRGVQLDKRLATLTNKLKELEK